MFRLLFFITSFFCIYSQEIYVSNLNPRCMRCLCAAGSGCTDESLGCSAGYCGPFQISKNYWLDAVKDTPLDSTDEIAYERCVNNYQCAAEVVTYYIAKFAKDCNHDGVTSCEDFLMINYNGGYGCERSLYRNPNSKLYLQRYTNCTANFII